MLPGKFKDLIMDIGTEEIGHVEMLATMVAPGCGPRRLYPMTDDPLRVCRRPDWVATEDEDGNHARESPSRRRWVSMPGRDDLPSTLRRSPDRAQRTWVEAHDSALRTYGPGRRAQQTAYAALKHSFEKVGDHWEPKGRRGPSDEQAERGAGQPVRPTAGGVDANASKQHLYERARQLGIPGRSSMSKAELVDALRKASRRRTARARARR